MENLLTTPVRPAKVIVEGNLPWVVIGDFQPGVTLGSGFVLFEVLMVGSFTLLLAMRGVFIIANLGVVLTLSTIGKKPVAARTLADAGFFKFPAWWP